MELCWVAGGGLRVAPGMIRRDLKTILTTTPRAAKQPWRRTATCCSPTLGDPRHDQG